jgi:hypothetical protein
MAVWKGDLFTRIEWYLFRGLCIILLLFAVYKVLKAEWPF